MGILQDLCDSGAHTSHQNLFMVLHIIFFKVVPVKEQLKLCWA